MGIQVSSGNPLLAALSSSPATGASSADPSLFAALFADPLLGTGLATGSQDALNTLLASDNASALADALKAGAVGDTKNARLGLQALLQSQSQEALPELTSNNPRLALEAATQPETPAPDAISNVFSQLGIPATTGKTGTADKDEKTLKSETQQPKDGRELQGLINTPSAPPETPVAVEESAPATTETSSTKLSVGSEAAKSAVSELATGTHQESAKPGEQTPNVFAQTLQVASQRVDNSDNAATSAASSHIAAHVQDKAAWPQQLGDRVVWMNQQGQQTAEIHLNPSQLGPLHITLNIQGDQTTATFVSAHAEVRQAIQDALPQLRDAFSNAGIELGQTNVNSQSQQQQQTQQQLDTSTPRYRNDAAILSGETEQGAVSKTVSSLRRGNGMVDLFA